MKFQEKTLEVSYKSVVILRILLSLIFIIASISHFFNTEKIVSRIEDSAFGLPDTVEIIPNGILYRFQFIKKGFITLTI